MATDFTMVAGDTRTIIVTVDDGAGGVVSLENASIRWKLARFVTSRPALVEKSTDPGSGITIKEPVGDAAWTFEVALLPEDTEGLKGVYFHEAEVIDDADNVSTVLQGAATIEPALIKPAA